jgi:hypothetical protein
MVTEEQQDDKEPPKEKSSWATVELHGCTRRWGRGKDGHRPSKEEATRVEKGATMHEECVCKGKAVPLEA